MAGDTEGPESGGTAGDGLSPEGLSPQEERVRELLAAEVAEPMPEDVAERLTLVIREQARDRSATGPARTKTVPLRPLRPLRRWLPATAVAAVLLGVIAVAVPQVLSGQRSATSAGSSSSASAPQREDAQPGQATNAPPSASATQRHKRGERNRGEAAMPKARPTSRVPLRTGSLHHDVRVRVADRGLSPPPVDARLLDRLRCRGGTVQTSQGLPVEVDGGPARLFTTGPAGAGSYRVVSCASGAPIVVADSGPGTG